MYRLDDKLGIVVKFVDFKHEIVYHILNNFKDFSLKHFIGILIDQIILEVLKNFYFTMNHSQNHIVKNNTIRS